MLDDIMPFFKLSFLTLFFFLSYSLSMSPLLPAVSAFSFSAALSFFPTAS